jgi:hypothetical protein
MKHSICITPYTGSLLEKAMDKMRSHASAKTLATMSLLFLCVSAAHAQAIRQDAGTKILIPSSSRTTTFTSLLAVINLDSHPNEVTITARRSDGTLLGSPISTTIPVGGRFRSDDILRDMGVPVHSWSYGPIVVESTNSRLLSAVSDVVNSQGPGGFFPAVNATTAWREGFITDVTDTGDSGDAGTFRTNLGVNNLGEVPADVTIAFFDDSGRRLGATSITVPANGMTQLNSVVRTLLSSRHEATGRNGFLKLASNQPIHAWATKVENGAGDPSFQIGVAAAASMPRGE